MQTTATVSPPTAALADDAFRAPLPGMTVGDSAVTAPRLHEWPGRLFIACSYAIAGALGLGVLIFGAFALRYGLEPRHWVRVGAAAVWAVLQWRLGLAVSRFSRWGWYGAMAGLGGAALVKLGLAVMIPITAGNALVVAAINGAWMRYFWKRRDQFDVDLGG
ncbi:MAG TPA: hypothetical protein VGX50_04080 [Longimicrobium sp.]|jgi:hypothetical protein|nr:hypothetical protein [Longimicrobium sp.]